MDLVLELFDSAQPAADYASLERTLKADDAMRGTAVQARQSKPDGGAMGPVVEALLIGLGSGGMGVALVEVLGNWLPTRRSDVRIRVSHGDQEIEVDLKRVRDPEVAARLLRMVREEPPK